MKIKTHSGTKKRVKKTATGKMKVAKSGQRHLLAQKSKGQKRGFRRGYEVPSAMAGQVKKLLPHG